jgi:hypothetical protein
VWYVFTAGQSGTARALTKFATDTVLSLYRLEPGPRLVFIRCNDDGGGSPPYDGSVVGWGAPAGKPHYLRVGTKNGQAGAFTLRFDTLLAPARPANASAETALSIWPGTYRGYMRAGTGIPTACLSYGEGLWFTYVPKTSGTARVATGSLDPGLDSFYDTAIDLEENGVLIHCADSRGGGEVWTFPVQAGAEYTIRVGSADGSEGVYAMTLEGPECVGRTCDDPETIAEGTRFVSLVGATASGSASCSSGLPGPEVARYFRHVAAADGTLNVSTCGTTSAAIHGYTVDARLSLHAGCPADPPTELACSTDSLLCRRPAHPDPARGLARAVGALDVLRRRQRHGLPVWQHRSGPSRLRQLVRRGRRHALRERHAEPRGGHPLARRHGCAGERSNPAPAR